MKILNSEQIRAADQYTIEHEPIASIDLMERAAGKCVDWVLDYRNTEECTDLVFHIFCGIGNNGGDGLVMARLLSTRGAKVVVYVVRFSEKSSAGFNLNYDRLPSEIKLVECNSKEDFEPIEEGIIVDAILGSGISRKIDGLISDAVVVINRSEVPVIAIDAPTGLFDEKNDDLSENTVVKADHTLVFESPRLSFLVPDSGAYAGYFHVLDIGLNKEFLEKQESPYQILQTDEFRSLVRPRNRFDHKGNNGRALIVGGSKGKIGAVSLATRAALRSGIGLITSLVPECGYEVLQTTVQEAMCLTSGTDQLAELTIPRDTSAIGIGPGLDIGEGPSEVVKRVCLDYTIPLVIDADALNIIANNKTWLEFLPADTILTPHIKEFDRLFGPSETGYDRLQLARNVAVRYKCHIILKGANTAVISPRGNVYFNPSGNPGMATGGTGDVLTGILTSLRAQGYEGLHAALLGVYLHGIAGDLAREDKGVISMTAGDLIDHLPGAFTELEGTDS